MLDGSAAAMVRAYILLGKAVRRKPYPRPRASAACYGCGKPGPGHLGQNEMIGNRTGTKVFRATQEKWRRALKNNLH